MYGSQLEAAHAGFVVELKGLDVLMLVVNAGEGGQLNLGVPRNVREDSILHCVSACVEVRSFFCMVLAVVPASERFGLSNQDVLPWQYAWG